MSSWKESANKRREHRQAPIDCRKPPGKRKSRKSLPIVVMCESTWFGKTTVFPAFHAKSMEEAERWLASTRRRHPAAYEFGRMSYWIEDAKP